MIIVLSQLIAGSFVKSKLWAQSTLVTSEGSWRKCATTFVWSRSDSPRPTYLESRAIPLWVIGWEQNSVFSSVSTCWCELVCPRPFVSVPLKLQNHLALSHQMGKNKFFLQCQPASILVWTCVSSSPHSLNPTKTPEPSCSESLDERQLGFFFSVNMHWCAVNLCLLIC